MRRNRVATYLTDRELRDLKGLAAREGVTVSTFVADMIVRRLKRSKRR